MSAPGGRLALLAASPEAAAAAAAWVAGAPAGRRSEPVELAGRAAHLKASPLAGRARWRHAFRAHVLGRSLPRFREYENLAWLRARDFRAPEPLAAGALWGGALPRFQFLFSAEVPAARTLLDELETGDPALRPELLGELAREVARLHALGFVHRDLYPRNLLVAERERGRRLVFLDAWAGGPGLQLRGAAYDLACFFLEGSELLAPEEEGELLAGYFAERAARGRPVERQAFLGRVVRARAALFEQLQRDPGRRRGRPLPRADWRPPAGAADHSR